MSVAVIPARGGSKRIPGKNIRAFCGRPIIAYSVEAALRSGAFERVIVSTDDDDIARVAAEHGADVPFKRPPELSDDHTGTAPVIVHAAEALGVQDDRLICCIYATAPFLLADDLLRGRRILEEQRAAFAFSVTSYAFPIQRALRMDGGRVEMFRPDAFETRSQDLEEAWHDAGQFYWGSAAAWRSGRPIFSRDSAAVPLPRHRVQDIDTEEDWARAELMFQALGDADRDRAAR